ncbi:MAG: TraB/GumN family protein [Candidatus Heimdallarchaeota archaeon]|nr:TraB/GumN family protein [Candidatus Heimdallarchaeota archaeon]
MVKITLVGITHIDVKSQKKVADIINSIKPDAVCLELDEYRLNILRDNDIIEKNNLMKLDKSSKNSLVESELKEEKEDTKNGFDFTDGFSTILENIGFFEGELARISNVDLPGKEMLVAYNIAKELGAVVYLIDRSIQDISKVMEEEVSIEEAKKFQDIIDELIYDKNIIAKPIDLFIEETKKIDEKEKKKVDIEKIETNDTINLEEVFELFNDQNSLRNILSTFSANFPKLYSILLEDRNIYMTKQILKVAINHSNIIVVLGYGHISEIEAALNEFGKGIQIEIIN